MSAGWKIGDLALCVDDGPLAFGGLAPRRCDLRKGCVYTVSGFGRSVEERFSLFLEGEKAIDQRSGYGFSVRRFRKIKPDAHDACEAEFVTLINRAKRPVPVMHTDGSGVGGMSAYRDLRLLETAPDAYVEFTQSQRQWAFSYHHPWLWRAYVGLARLRCRLAGHEWSPVWEHEKFDLANLGRSTAHCVFCGQSRGEQPSGGDA